MVSAVALTGAFADSLESLFDDPPQSRGANAWWHWLGANVTRRGISRDLESMRRAGLSGAAIFNIQDIGWSSRERMSTPLCPGLEYMNGKWWAMLSFAVSEAKRLGLELGLHNCPGYSTSGGPWITPELGMKKLVWAKGDAMPETKLGFYRDIAKVLTNDGVYRFGYTCTGKNTHPSPPDVEAGSLEADKMSHAAVSAHIDHLLGELGAHGIKASKPGLSFILMDSYEAGDATWTDDFADEFERRRGYNPIPFLPVLAGLGTEFSSSREDQFRRDFDLTRSELQVERHYGLFKTRLNAAGYEFHVEPYTGPFDSFEAAQHCDVPMSVFWHGHPFWMKKRPSGGGCWYLGPVSRALGRNVVGAEAFTGYPLDDPFSVTPRELKRAVDATFARGVNRLSLHHWVHQPLGEMWKPGFSMGPWGTHFGENQTWFEPAMGFYRYIQRCQALLQEGEMRCDALGLACSEEEGADALPLTGFLTNAAMTAGGRLRVKSSGREYSLLFLRRDMESRFMEAKPRDDVERRCFDVVRDYMSKGLEVGRAKDRKTYFGIVAGNGEGVVATCRRSGDVAFFLVANTSDGKRSFRARFRQLQGCDFMPEFWYPETCEKRCAERWNTVGDETTVEMSLDAEESVFVVFRRAGSQVLASPDRDGRRVVDLCAPWALEFDPDSGAPVGKKTLLVLKSWTDMDDERARYFSGTATYEAEVTTPAGRGFVLDLGIVRDVAEVFVDGVKVGSLWHAPYRIDLSRALAGHAGRHVLKIRVTNSWTNRLIGDEKEEDDCVLSRNVMGFGRQRIAGKGVVRDIPLGRAVLAFPEEVLNDRPRRVNRHAFSSWRYLLSDADLRPSGLLGPVRLEFVPLMTMTENDAD